MRQMPTGDGERIPGFRSTRSGDEPMHARSPLHLRLGLACLGLACAIAGMVVFALWHVVGLLVAFAVLAVVAVLDIAVVTRHIRAGAAFQPGSEVPPYRAARRLAPPPLPHPAVRPGVRHARYLLAVAAAVILLVNAWTWMPAVSLLAAIALTGLAIVLILAGVIAANVESPIERPTNLPPRQFEASGHTRPGRRLHR